jgi:hypothetical protein
MTGAMIKTEGPTQGRKGDRRRLRQEVRHMLGNSRDAAPTPTLVIRAARKLDDLLKLTTDGRYRVTVEVREGDGFRAAGVADFEQTRDRWAE